MAKVRLMQGDCYGSMRKLKRCSIDSVVTDPPYGLGAPFIGANWDDNVPGTQIWSKAFRALKPGGFVLSFGGTRTFHRVAVAIENAGFDVVDCLCWLYGSGFPKGYNVSKGIDRAFSAERPVVGTREGRRFENVFPTVDLPAPHEFNVTAPATDEAKQWEGWWTKLKPAWEPIILARKPLNGTVVGNVLAHGTGALNVDACRVGDTVETWPSSRSYGLGGSGGSGIVLGQFGEATGGVSKGETQKTGPAPPGRWPANVAHDGSNEAVAGFPGEGDKSAARYFYCAKASKTERGAGNVHPTVKPLALMRWLVRMVTQPGGVVLDPFMGSGSTGVAARVEGLRFVGMETEREYFEIARRRIMEARHDND